MTRRIGRGLVLAALAAVVCIPVSGTALHGGTVAECSGTTGSGGTGSCSTTFSLTTRGFVSNLETHAHFHQLLAEMGPTKFVTMEWRDASGLVYSSFCQDRGLSTGASGAGPSDLQNATCSSTYHKTKYAPGLQTLVVNAQAIGDATTGDEFHGKIVISADSSLI